MSPMNHRLMRPTGGFTPKSITNLAAWYDASVAGSITLNATTVSAWNDLSGNARHLTQATASLQPIYNATGLAGKGTLTTTGTQWMQAAAFASASTVTAFLVWKVDSTSGTPFVWQRGTVNDVHSMLMNPGLNELYARRGSANQGVVSVTSLQTGGVWRIATLVFSTTLSRIYNGSTQGTDNTASVAAPVGNKVLTLFALDSANLSGSPGIAEFIYYHDLLDDTKQAAVRAYLSRKWSLTL